MKRQEHTSSAKLNAKNKKTVMEQVRERLMAKSVDYVVYANQADQDDDEVQDDQHDDEAQDLIEPSMTTKEEGATMYLQMNRIPKPTKVQIKLIIRQHEALAKTIMKEHIDDDDVNRATKAGKTPWLLYNWMESFGKFGEASRIGSLHAKMYKQTLANCSNMKNYLRKISSLKDCIDDIQEGYVHKQQFFTLVLTNLGQEYTNSKTGAFRTVFKDLQKLTLRNEIVWEQMEAELLAAWEEEFPEDDEFTNGAQAETQLKTSGKQSGDDIALIVKEAATRAVREYAASANEGRRDGNKRGKGRRQPPRNRRDKEEGSSNRQCFNIRDTGRCRFGDKCRFEHTESKEGDRQGQKKRPHRDEWSADSDDEPPAKKKRGDVVFTAKENNCESIQPTPDAVLLMVKNVFWSFGIFSQALFVLSFWIGCRTFEFLRAQNFSVFNFGMRHVPTSSKIVALVSEFVYNANSTTDNGSMIIDSGASCLPHHQI
jgi:hypothetical protein